MKRMQWRRLMTLLGGWAALSVALPGLAAVVPVSDVPGLRTAIQNAAGGDEIVLAAGTYAVTSNLNCIANGSAVAPIIVRAAAPRSVLIRFSNPGSIAEGFKVSGSHWRFEGLDIEGACTSDSDCEHAFHVFGNAEFLQIRDNVVRDFNAQIKSNGSTVMGVFVFPDDGLIERNHFYDTRARNTSNPVTKLDIVGGRRWIVRANTINDYQKLNGDGVSYAAFLKGNSRDGLFERNLVRCSQAFSGGTRLGLSFGGGGTSPNSICEDGACIPEHQNGIMRNNLILSCSDVGVYLNSAANSRIQNNTIYAAGGIDVRFAASTADVRNNLLSGIVNPRNGGTSTNAGNLVSVPLGSFAAWFTAPAAADFSVINGSSIVNQGVAAPLVTDDFCANDRNDGQLDIGAFEYEPQVACVTTTGGGLPDRLFANGFQP